MTPVIRHDGALIFCCADLGSTLKLGTLHESRFSELWFSPKAQAIRKEHLEGTFNGVCSHCGGINWYQLKPERIKAYQERSRIVADSD